MQERALLPRNNPTSLRHVGSVVAHAEHTAEVIVHRTGKDATEHYPQISRRTIPCSHDGTKDGARTCNIEKLNHVYLPVRHPHVVNAIGMSGRRRGIVSWAKYMFHKSAVE